MPSFNSIQVIVTTVLLTLEDGEPRVVLLSGQDGEQAAGFSLISEVVKGNEEIKLQEIVKRSLAQQANVVDIYVEQLETVSGASGGDQKDSEPTIHIGYLGLMPESKMKAAREFSTTIRTFCLDALPSLPHNGRQLVSAAVLRLRRVGPWSVMPAFLLDEEFTIAQLNRAYDAVVGNNSFGANFRQKILKANILIPVGAKHTDGATRKAVHYSIRPGAFDSDIRL
ncbi:NrtR DNA-binding winged helix domain-containing protein [Rhizobium sp. AP16]|uniref:NrtR DNA-binding winged helix domain-containing protein n=1 Tax=Rhizobium sp. AP16 TaxID=1144306 RepID=UPI00026ED690|nr:hypothetical protein [Rhizobium sp. AP16]EJK81428.1 hypothetical protein PMI03_04459 [Rhizobium sp. AP16]